MWIGHGWISLGSYSERQQFSPAVYFFLWHILEFWPEAAFRMKFMFKQCKGHRLQMFSSSYLRAVLFLWDYGSSHHWNRKKKEKNLASTGCLIPLPTELIKNPFLSTNRWASVMRPSCMEVSCWMGMFQKVSAWYERRWMTGQSASQQRECHAAVCPRQRQECNRRWWGRWEGTQWCTNTSSAPVNSRHSHLLVSSSVTLGLESNLLNFRKSLVSLLQ